jgi:hypothetical protein
MSEAAAKRFDGAVGAVTGLLAVLSIGYGLSVVQLSGLAAAWFVAIGLCLVGAVLLGSTRGRRELGLPQEGGTQAATALVAAAAVLFVAFVALTGMSFEQQSSASGVVLVAEAAVRAVLA